RIDGPWSRAVNVGSTTTTLTATATSDTLRNGIHNIYFFATDGSEATLISPRPDNRPVLEETLTDSTQSSPILGAMNAYTFLVRSRSSLFDYDGDGKADLSIFRPSAGEWYYQQSSTGITKGFQFGTSNDRVATADFTGDW